MNSVFLKFAKVVSLSLLAILFFCASCSQSVKKRGNDGIPTIDIISNLSKTQKVNLSVIASKIDYCILETDKKCLIDGKNIYSSGDYFISISRNYCYIFERKTGKFIRQISQIGQGPEDYQYIFNLLIGANGHVCLLGNNQYLFFNLDGSLSHKINTKSRRLERSIAYEDYYVVCIHNSDGNSTIRIAFLDNKSGEIVDSIPNYRYYKRTTQSLAIENDYSFHIFNNELYYFDIYCDTLYQIKDFSLQPRYIFNTGGRTVPYESLDKGRIDIREFMEGRKYDRFENYIVINWMLEDVTFLYFTIEYRNLKYRAIYHKVENKIQIMQPVSVPDPRFIDTSTCGFENDLDGGLPFWPQQMISDKEMMCVYTAADLMELDRSRITDPKLKNVLNSLVEDSNPVVAIITLKD